jgi:hypothetical protein
MADLATEFDCSECGRHIVVIAGEVNEARLCASCLTPPGWFREPAIRAILDPEHDGPKACERPRRKLSARRPHGALRCRRRPARRAA